MMNIRQQILNQDLERENRSYRCLTFFVMLCMMIMLCKSMFSYRLVDIHGYIVQAGQLVASIWFILSDLKGSSLWNHRMVISLNSRTHSRM